MRSIPKFSWDRGSTPLVRANLTWRTWGAEVTCRTGEAVEDEREVRTVGAALAGAAAAALGSSEPAGVDRHEAAITGLHGRAVGRAVVREQAAAGELLKCTNK